MRNSLRNSLRNFRRNLLRNLCRNLMRNLRRNLLRNLLGVSSPPSKARLINSAAKPPAERSGANKVSTYTCFLPGTYYVPPGSSAQALRRGRRQSLMGWGRVGRSIKSVL